MPLTLKKKFGRRLRQLREEASYTQAELAELTSRTEETISNIERGVSAPSWSLLEAFAVVFDCEMKDLFIF